MAYDPIKAGRRASQRRHGARIDQLSRARELADLEAQSIKDRAVWNSMSKEQRISFSRYLNARATVGESGFTPALGPAAWLTEQRLQASAASAPWDASREWLASAEGMGQTAVEGWLRRRTEELDAARKRLASMQNDLSQLEAFRQLEVEIAAEQKDLDRISGLPAVEQFASWEDARPGFEEHRETLRRRGSETVGLDPDQEPDSGDRDVEL